MLRLGTMLGTIAGILRLKAAVALLFVVGACLGQVSGSSGEGRGSSSSSESVAGAEREERKAWPAARVLLVDDLAFMRVAMRATLGNDDTLEVVGEAKDGQEAVARCRELKPDLVLMDVVMPGMDGIEATMKIKSEFPKTSVLILTVHSDQRILMEAVKAGAAGYVLKEDDPERVLGSVRAVLEGDTPLDQGLAMRLLRSIGEEEASAQSGSLWGAASAQPYTLTRREREVLGLLAFGRTNRQIAQELHLSQRTVGHHVSKILRKLHLASRSQIAAWATEQQLLAPEPD